MPGSIVLTAAYKNRLSCMLNLPREDAWRKGGKGREGRERYGFMQFGRPFRHLPMVLKTFVCDVFIVVPNPIMTAACLLLLGNGL